MIFKASIIICTYNRAAYLLKVLEKLTEIDFDKKLFEVIVIDNNSTDNTSGICKEFIRNNCERINFKYRFEENAGLSFARNRGIKESEGDYILFLDDDAIPGKNWLKEVIYTFQNEKCDVVGGKVNLIYERKKPDWLTEELELYLTKLDYGEKVKEINPLKEWLVGANIAFDRKVFRKYQFSVDLGRKKSHLLSGEEIEIYKKIYSEGGKIIYSPSAIVNHYVPQNRITKSFFRKRVFWGGYSIRLIEKKLKNKSLFQLITVNILDLLKNIVLYLLFMIRKNRFAYELNLLSNLGYLWGLVTNSN